VYGLACLTNSTHDLLFVLDRNVVRAHDRSSKTVVWELELYSTTTFDSYSPWGSIALSPDLRHMAFSVRGSLRTVGFLRQSCCCISTNSPVSVFVFVCLVQAVGGAFNIEEVGVINIATKQVDFFGNENGEFQLVRGLDWSTDGRTIVVSSELWFAGLRFVDMESGDVTSRFVLEWFQALLRNDPCVFFALHCQRGQLDTVVDCEYWPGRQSAGQFGPDCRDLHARFRGGAGRRCRQSGLFATNGDDGANRSCNE
jgi:hypothetical protein